MSEIDKPDPQAAGPGEPPPTAVPPPAYQAPPAAEPITAPLPAPPAWMPPASAPRKGMPTAVKVVAGGMAAGLIALCSGVAGGVIATQLDGNDFRLPSASNGAAPVINPSSLAEVAAKVQPSVVSVQTDSGEGSGVILTDDGYILTNNHVVESARGGSVNVVLADGKTVPGTVVGTDSRIDLAVVKAEAGGLTPAVLGDSDTTAVGDQVLAVGSPLGLQGSVTAGIVSAKNRTIGVGESRGVSLSGLLQTDAPINPGNSGGALVNTAGEVIGINTAIYTDGSSEGNIGVGFAIPSNKARDVAEALIEGREISYPFLGVSVRSISGGGALIDTVTPDSPAESAGLQQGDVVVKFGDRAINTPDDLVSAVQSGKVGQQVTVEFVRDGSDKTATVTLGEAS